MSAYKKHEGRKYFLDMTNIKANQTFLHMNAMSRKKQRELKRIDPFAHRIGKYRKYKTPDELQKHIDEYFDSCMTALRTKDGEPVYDENGEELRVQTKPYTISGMANHLGVTTNTLRTYQTRSVAGKIPPEYAQIILRARQKIEEYAECQLYSRDGSRGGQFVLQAGFGWLTKQERSEIKFAKKKIKMQQKELEMKQKLLDSGDENDSTVEIKITRAKGRVGSANNDEE